MNNHTIIRNIIEFLVEDNIIINYRYNEPILKLKFVNRAFWNVINSLSKLYLRNKKHVVPNKLGCLEIDSFKFGVDDDYLPLGNYCHVDELVIACYTKSISSLISQLGIIANRLTLDSSIIDDAYNLYFHYDELSIKGYSYSVDTVGIIDGLDKLKELVIDGYRGDSLDSVLPDSIEKLILRVEGTYFDIDVSKFTKLTEIEIEGNSMYDLCNKCTLPKSVVSFSTQVPIVMLDISECEHLENLEFSYYIHSDNPVIRIPFLPRLKSLIIRGICTVIVNKKSLQSLKKIELRQTRINDDTIYDSIENGELITNCPMLLVPYCKNLEILDVNVIDYFHKRKVLLDLRGLKSLKETRIWSSHDDIVINR